MPCSLDLAHQPIATATGCAGADELNIDRRDHILKANDRLDFGTRWSADGLYELAGYAAWLCVDAWDAGGKHDNAAKLADHARQLGTFDPRIELMHANRLTHQDHAKAEAVVKAAPARRTTDPGFDELAEWWDHYLAYRSSRPKRRTRRPGASTRVARPVGRTRPPRFRT